MILNKNKNAQLKIENRYRRVDNGYNGVISFNSLVLCLFYSMSMTSPVGMKNGIDLACMFHPDV